MRERQSDHCEQRPHRADAVPPFPRCAGAVRRRHSHDRRGRRRRTVISPRAANLPCATFRSSASPWRNPSDVGDGAFGWTPLLATGMITAKRECAPFCSGCPGKFSLRKTRSERCGHAIPDKRPTDQETYHTHKENPGLASSAFRASKNQNINSSILWINCLS